MKPRKYHTYGSTSDVSRRSSDLSTKRRSYVLGQLVAKTASTSMLKSQYVLKEKLVVIEMQADHNKAIIYEILADISKG